MISLGKVLWFDSVKGFGFIEQEDPDADNVFVHHSDVVGEGYRELMDGDEVEFTILQATKGPKATNVVVVGNAGADTDADDD